MIQNNPFSLLNKTVLITGASSGIGRAIAIECSRLQANVVLTGRNKERLQETFDSLFWFEQAEHVMITADLSSSSDVVNLIDNTSLLDGLVLCAGITKIVPFQFVDENDLSSVMEINFFSPYMLIQKLLKKKKIQKNASVVFVSSISGYNCSAVASSIYSASKGAVNGAVKGIALDLAGKGIRVNTINPGMIDTDILSSGEITEEQLKEDVKRYPLKRYGKPEEVAYAAIYLLSDASRWVTGSNLVIDGGYTLL